eukprot:scaffold600_cov125-Isochrysis_galbana.AAC.1
MWSHPMSAFTSTPSERTMDEDSSKWRYLISGWVSQLPAGAEGAPYRLMATSLEKMAELVGLWHVGRLCLATATAPLGLRMWTIHAAPWKGKRAVSSGE